MSRDPKVPAEAALREEWIPHPTQEPLVLVKANPEHVQLGGSRQGTRSLSINIHYGIHKPEDTGYSRPEAGPSEILFSWQVQDHQKLAVFP